MAKPKHCGICNRPLGVVYGLGEHKGVPVWTCPPDHGCQRPKKGNK